MIRQNICNLFFEQVKSNPDRMAVILGSNGITYQQLNKKANNLANFLIKNPCISRQLKVGITLNRSIELIVVILAAIKANAVCVPLDPSYPEARLNFMAENSEIDVLITTTQMVDLVPKLINNYKNKLIHIDRLILDELHHDELTDFNNSNIEDLIYILYTSGSTGEPKGVAMPHKVISNLINWHLINTNISGEECKILQYAPISFDVSFQEIFSTLCSGKTLVLIPDHIRTDPLSLFNFLKENHISQIFIPVVTLQQLALVTTNDVILESLKTIITSGEQLKITPEIRLFFSKMPNISLYNHYGPTETHLVTSYKLPEDYTKWPDLPPIGLPIENIRTYILDENMCQVANKNAGELYIGGEYIANGYYNNSKLTKDRFINNPFEEGKLYKTGDVVCLKDDNCLHFVERRDQQVKIRGFRVEINEIEMTLLKHPKIKECVIVDMEIKKSYKNLVAYIILDINAILNAKLSENGQILSTELTIELNQFLSGKLPSYMIPSLYIMIDKIPLTVSNKVDRNALPKVATSDFDSLINTIKSSNKTMEEKITLIWESVLQISPIAKDQNFFDMGGHSLLLLPMHKMLLEVFEYDFPIVVLLQNSTIESLTYFLAHAKYPEIKNDLISKRTLRPSDSFSTIRKKIRAQTKQKDFVYD